MGDARAITDIAGIRVGHWTDRRAVTSCNVILCGRGATGGVDVRGATPGTRETDLMRPMNLVQNVNAIVLAGGSAFGLNSAGDGSVRTGPEEGYQACRGATREDVESACVGAGTGAITGGLGTGSETMDDSTVISAILAVNAFDEIIDPEDNSVVAGPRSTEGEGFFSTIERFRKGRAFRTVPGANTTIAVIATNTRLNKEQANKLAQIARASAMATGQRTPASQRGSIWEFIRPAFRPSPASVLKASTTTGSAT